MLSTPSEDSSSDDENEGRRSESSSHSGAILIPSRISFTRFAKSSRTPVTTRQALEKRRRFGRHGWRWGVLEEERGRCRAVRRRSRRTFGVNVNGLLLREGETADGYAERWRADRTKPFESSMKP